jgi:hypothetical protein
MEKLGNSPIFPTFSRRFGVVFPTSSRRGAVARGLRAVPAGAPGAGAMAERGAAAVQARGWPILRKTYVYDYTL